ncbi:MAG: metalloregulator ArsR/SmtB family transcription factor [Candidatus Nanopelagicales bacterium]|nr:metalloregulator ArsR/SmtB family transcription factor [Candidatus Nanopelagicales bacterium]MDZ4249192.1 metalloregulator ArsR/SmtB family transcription factor [Candidatus Nanopelagicales bacterium]
MINVQTSQPAVETINGETLAKFFRALGDPTRLRLLEFLMDGERSVSECVEHAGLSQGRVSIHLACLADCGYISARRQGRWCYYSVSDPRVAELVHLARSLARDNRAELDACQRIDSKLRSGSASRSAC